MIISVSALGEITTIPVQDLWMIQLKWHWFMASDSLTHRRCCQISTMAYILWKITCRYINSATPEPPAKECSPLKERKSKQGSKTCSVRCGMIELAAGFSFGNTFIQSCFWKANCIFTKLIFSLLIFLFYKKHLVRHGPRVARTSVISAQ